MPGVAMRHPTKRSSSVARSSTRDREPPDVSSATRASGIPTASVQTGGRKHVTATAPPTADTFQRRIEITIREQDVDRVGDAFRGEWGIDGEEELGHDRARSGVSGFVILPRSRRSADVARIVQEGDVRRAAHGGNDHFVKRRKDVIGGNFYERGVTALMNLVRQQAIDDGHRCPKPVSVTGRFCDDCGLRYDRGVSEVSVGGVRASFRFFSIAGGKESDLCVSCVAEFLADAAVTLRGEAG